MTTAALFGAGGKMGLRLGRNLSASAYATRPVEVNPAGRDRVKASLGWDCLDPAAALDGAEIVVLAAPTPPSARWRETSRLA